MTDRLHRLASRTASRLAALDESLYVVLIGSVADGTADEHSDIDLLVLYGNEPTEKAIADSLETASIKKFHLDDHHFHAHYSQEGKTHAVLFTPPRRIERFVGDYPDLSFDEYAELSRYVVFGDLMHGDDRRFWSWQKTCMRVPTEMKRACIEKDFAGLRFYIRQGTLLPFAERSDWIMANRTINECVVSMLRILYLLNDEIMIKPKMTRQSLDRFTKKPPEASDRLESLYLHQNTFADVQKKVDQLASVLDDLEELIRSEPFAPTST